MTVKQARKLLGVLAKDVSDEDLERDIKTATLLKDIFFDLRRQKAAKLSGDQGVCNNQSLP